MVAVDPFTVSVGLSPTLRAVTEAAMGVPVDVPALRALLVHLQDQHDAMAASSWVREAWVGRVGAATTRDLVSVCDRLEVGDVRGAGRRLAAVFRLRLGMGAPLDWRRL